MRIPARNDSVMKIKIICIGKTDKGFVNEGYEEYLGRLKHYAKVEKMEIPDLKSDKAKQSREALKEAEGKELLKNIERPGVVVLLDENGKSFSSRELAERLEGFQNRSVKALNLLIGGAFGFSPEVKAEADEQWSLSKMTFSHQMVRMILAEQLYRAHTIIRGESYHHD
jgi:23S rRNA (pseudouridine1915-N3)-methyltransferase